MKLCKVVSVVIGLSAVVVAYSSAVSDGHNRIGSFSKQQSTDSQTGSGGSGGCVMYDPTMAASTIEEVVYNFVNPLNLSPPEAPSETNCTTRRCPSCAMDMARRLMQLNVIGMTKYWQLLSESGFANPDHCKYYNFTHTTSGSSTNSLPLQTEDGVLFGSNEESVVQKLVPPPNRACGVATYTETTMNCHNVREMDNGTGGVWPCRICWSLVELPEGHIPRYLSQVKCGTKLPTACLSRNGTCIEQVVPMNIQSNGGTCKDVQYVGRWCQCSINYNSMVAHVFV